LTPIEFHRKNKDTVYYAGNVVAQSTESGLPGTWEAISPDLGEGDAGRETNPLYANHYGTVQTVGLNEKEPNIIYAGTDNGRLWKTTNHGGDWIKLTDEALPNRWVTHVEVEQDQPSDIYVSYSGYRQGDNAAYVLSSKNGGESFTNISNNLPKAPVNDVLLVGRQLFVASDVGVFTKRTDDARWLKLGRGLPLSPINDLRYVPENETLFAGTFGRGIYKIRPPRRY
jgi:hypothetical protein